MNALVCLEPWAIHALLDIANARFQEAKADGDREAMMRWFKESVRLMKYLPMNQYEQITPTLPPTVTQAT